MTVRLRHIVFILVSIVLIGCAMDSKMKSEDVFNASESNENVNTAENYKDGTSMNQKLISEKLQDFYDLIALQQQHPEFTDEVIEQLRTYTTDSISNFDTEDALIVKNIRIIGRLTPVNDSIQKLKFAYDRLVDSHKTTDTIYALLRKKTVTVDGETFISHKIRFSKH